VTNLTVVIPVGPNCKPEFVTDTIESVDHYVPSRRLILMDDSGKGTAALALGQRNGQIVSVQDKGLAGGLFATLGLGFQRALETDFDILLRLDTDALVTGDSFVRLADRAFRQEPTIGSLGSYRFDYLGNKRSFSYARNRLIWEATLGVFTDRERTAALWKVIGRARNNGYQLGESIMGGVAVYSRNAVAALEESGALTDSTLARSSLQEDHLFAMHLMAAGFKLGEFAGEAAHLPMGVKHRGLPMAPKDLIRAHKSLVHSTKYFGELSEADIRAQFRAARAS